MPIQIHILVHVMTCTHLRAFAMTYVTIHKLITHIKVLLKYCANEILLCWRCDDI